MIHVIGVDWKTASLAVREQLAACDGEEQARAVCRKRTAGVMGGVLLQTCNRLEWYLEGPEDLDARGLWQQVWGEGFPLFHYHGKQAHRRLCEVACGLHSQIVGEEQILTQVKRALETARKAGQATPELEVLFRAAVTAGKEAREKVCFQAAPPSCASAAMELAEKKLGALWGKRALVIGNGEMGRLAAGLLTKAGCLVTVTLRSYRHGEAEVPWGCAGIPYDRRMEAAEGCDLLLSATRSPHFTVTADQMARLKCAPRLVVDLAMPRDVEPACHGIGGSCLVDLDSLGNGTGSCGVETERVGEIVEKHLQKYNDWAARRLRYLPGRREKLAVFAGTEEGRALCEYLSGRGIEATAFVASAYGEALLERLPGVETRAGRLEAGEMAEALAGYDTVVDATHPYAGLVSGNIKKAVALVGARYLRLARPATGAPDAITVPHAQGAAEYLAQTEGPVLLATGSKELSLYTTIPRFAERIYPRILPDSKVIAYCRELGFPASHLIAMQGPFSHEMNVAMLRSIGAKWLVTKDGGRAGGMPQKLSAAREAGVRVLLIARPEKSGAQEGFSLEEIERLLGDEPKMEGRRFPLFIDLAGKPCLVVGGGTVGMRRAQVLRRFGAVVTLVDPGLAKHLPGMRCLARPFRAGDTRGMALVVAATGMREVNRQVAGECRLAGIPVSVADCPEECSFFFPAICESERLTAGIVSDGGHHSLVARGARAVRERLKEIDG